MAAALDTTATKDTVLTWVLNCCAGAYKAEFQGVPPQRRSLAANALASWNGSGGGSQAGASGAAASAVKPVMPCASSPTPPTLQICKQLYELTGHMPENIFILCLLIMSTLSCCIAMLCDAVLCDAVLCEDMRWGSWTCLPVGALVAQAQPWWMLRP